MNAYLPWIIFVGFVMVMLAIDLGVFNRKVHVVSMRESLVWTCVWICVSMTFNVLIYYAYENHWLGIGIDVGHDVGGKEAATEFFTGYVIEKSLSVDNIFIIAIIFAHFKVPEKYQHRTLYWGILGALIMRGAMIGAGAALIERFAWIMYFFGAMLLYTAMRMMVTNHDEETHEEGPLVRLAKRLFRVHDEFEGQRFFTRIDGKRAMTRLFLALLAVEGADVVFAVDSIPAIFAITTDPFLVFTSNIFAILGLRSLYFTLSAAMHRFRFIQPSLAFLLAFIGVKMLIVDYFHIPAWVSLTVIGGILGTGVGASVWDNYRRQQARKHEQH